MTQTAQEAPKGLLDLLQQQQPAQHVITCHGCNDTITGFHTGGYHGIAIGFSHYHVGDDGKLQRSYMQIYETPYTCPDCGRDAALKAAHAHIDNHVSLRHGEYSGDVQHPATGDPFWSEQQKQEQQGWATYHDSPTAYADLPKWDAITGLSLEVAKDIYVPHVTECNPPAIPGQGGYYYQEVIQRLLPGTSVAQATLGTATYENALILAHKIVDEILQPAYQSRLEAVQGASK